MIDLKFVDIKAPGVELPGLDTSLPAWSWTLSPWTPSCDCWGARTFTTLPLLRSWGETNACSIQPTLPFPSMSITWDGAKLACLFKPSQDQHYFGTMRTTTQHYTTLQKHTNKGFSFFVWYCVQLNSLHYFYPFYLFFAVTSATNNYWIKWFSGRECLKLFWGKKKT